MTALVSAVPDVKRPDYEAPAFAGATRGSGVPVFVVGLICGDCCPVGTGAGMTNRVYRSQFHKTKKAPGGRLRCLEPGIKLT